ncbi:MAG: hypothetical protein J6L59_05100, partial [Clostridia bacterium]|nr:hypothetical protein [Clostridia bacterium]
MIIEKNKKIFVAEPENATNREKFAVSELKKYIKRIFGVELCVVTGEKEDLKCAFLIGGPERNTITKKYISEEEFDKTVPGPEGIFIKSFGDCIVLAGSSKNVNECERGTLYAVYEFLERFLGCSLSAYIKEGVAGGEYISKKEKADLTDIFYVKKKADIPYRAAVAQYSAHGKGEDYELDIAFLDWLSKNRYNYIYTWNSVYEHFKENGMLLEAIKRGILFKVGHHDAIDTLLPQKGNKYFSEPYFETHPE